MSVVIPIVQDGESPTDETKQMYGISLRAAHARIPSTGKATQRNINSNTRQSKTIDNHNTIEN